MFLKFKPWETVDVYHWKDPDTGTTFSCPSKSELINRITAYRSQNNLEEIEHLSVVLDNYQCSLPGVRAKCEPATMERGFLGYLKGGVSLIKTLVYSSFAPQEVADKRSAQCARCPHNVFPDKKGFIQWSDKIAEHSTLGRRSLFHEKLGNCGVCSCPLRAKVFYNGTVEIEPSWEGPMREVQCWQLSLDPRQQRKTKTVANILAKKKER